MYLFLKRARYTFDNGYGIRERVGDVKFRDVLYLIRRVPFGAILYLTYNSFLFFGK